MKEENDFKIPQNIENINQNSAQSQLTKSPEREINSNQLCVTSRSDQKNFIKLTNNSQMPTGTRSASKNKNNNLINNYNNLIKIFVSKENSCSPRKTYLSQAESNKLNINNLQCNEEQFKETKSTVSRGGEFYILNNQNEFSTPKNNESSRIINHNSRGKNHNPITFVRRDKDNTYSESKTANNITHTNEKSVNNLKNRDDNSLLISDFNKEKSIKPKIQSNFRFQNNQDKGKIDLSEYYFVQTIRFCFNYYFRFSKKQTDFEEDSHKLYNNIPSKPGKNQEKIGKSNLETKNPKKKKKERIYYRSKSVEELEIDKKVYSHLFLFKFLEGLHNEKLIFYDQKGKIIPLKVQSIISFCIKKKFEENNNNLSSLSFGDDSRQKKQSSNINKIFFKTEIDKHPNKNQTGANKKKVQEKLLFPASEVPSESQTKEQLIKDRLTQLLATEKRKNEDINLKQKTNANNFENQIKNSHRRNIDDYWDSNSKNKLDKDEFFDKLESPSNFSEKFNLTTKTNFSNHKPSEMIEQKQIRLNYTDFKIGNYPKTNFLDSQMAQERKVFYDTSEETQLKVKKLLESSKRKTREYNESLIYRQDNKYKKEEYLYLNHWIYPPNEIPEAEYEIVLKK